MDAKAAAGVTRYSRELAAALAQAGEPVRELRARPYEVRIGQRRFGGFLTMKAQSLLRPLVKRDLLHSTYHYAAHPRCDVATVHDLFPETLPELGFGPKETARLAKTTRRLRDRGVRLVCDSMHTQRELARLHDVEATQAPVVHPGIHTRFAPATGGDARHPAFPADSFNVLCVADLNPRKRLDWLLQAALDADVPGLRVVHVGPQTVRRPPWARQQELEAPLAARLGDRFTRLGRLGDDELVGAYRSADLLVLPTLDEGFGYPPLEALACGTPVAVTDIPVLRETLGSQAHYFRDADGLAGVLQAASRRRSTDGERAMRHRWVQDTHGWPQAANRMRAVYQEARAAGPGRRA